MKKNVVIFARGNNKGEQIEKLEAFADKKGYEVAEIIVDDVMLLIEYVPEMNVEISSVLVTDHSRISRKQGEYIRIKNELNFMDIDIECIPEGSETKLYDAIVRHIEKVENCARSKDTAEDRFRQALIGWHLEALRDILSEAGYKE